MDALLRVTAQPPSLEDRELASRFEERRIASETDLAQMRLRYEEVMRWINPPWNDLTGRLDPRPEQLTAERSGRPKIHVSLTDATCERWAVLQAGAAPTCRVVPRYVSLPDPSLEDPEEQKQARREYDIDRAIAQSQSTQMENITREWSKENDFHRTLLWMTYGTAAFGKAICRVDWDRVAGIPTFELLENPSQVGYGWTKRFGRRRLSWVILVEQIAPEEAERRFGIQFPRSLTGQLDFNAWTTGIGSTSTELDLRAEQQGAVNQMVWVGEYWEWLPFEADGTTRRKNPVVAAVVVAGRVLDRAEFPWKQLPFRVFEDSHIPTWNHGRSVAERMIPLNEAYDDMLNLQHEVIEFEAGPRYKGLNMAHSTDEVEMPNRFEMLPLREGEDVQQIDTRVDFWPAQVHAEELREAIYHATGLTPIAWGMSPNAQTSGRALSAEWRAVELPLASKLINMVPEIRETWAMWWDMAEFYEPETYKEISEGHRNFEVVFEPLDIRDSSERSLEAVQLLNANVVDPEWVHQRIGIENGDEVMARLRTWLMDPVWNPLRYQQYLILQQLELQIQQQRMEMGAMQEQLGGGEEGAGELPAEASGAAQQGAVAAGQAAQGPAGPVTEANNQPGAAPGTLPVDTSVLSQTPLVGGVGNRAIVQGPTPTGGVQAR